MASYTWDELPAVGTSETMETDIRDTLEQWRQNMEDMNEEWDALSVTGDVSGPASSVDERIAIFDGTDGKTIKDSGHLLSEYATQADLIALSIALGG